MNERKERLMKGPDMTTPEGRAGLSARLRRREEAADMGRSDGLGADPVAVFRVYHAGMHADYETSDDVVAAFEGLSTARGLRALCSAAKSGTCQFALLNDGSKFLVEYTKQKV